MNWAPPAVAPEARLLLISRALRALVDGCVAVVLPAYLLALGFGTWEVGLLGTATLFGSAFATLAVGAWGHCFQHRHLLRAAAILMAATGLCFAGLSAFWPLLVVAFVGTLNPSSGDVSVFLPLEQARLAEAAHDEARTALFARYSLIGALCAALGSLAAAIPEFLSRQGIDRLAALRGMFIVYAAIGVAIWLLYRRLPEPPPHEQTRPPQALGPSRGIVVRLATLFSVDAFAGGLLVNSLLALWLFQRFDLSLAAAGSFFFWAGLLTALSQLAAPRVARRAAHRPAEHDGVHAHSRQHLPDPRGACAQPASRARLAPVPERAVADGRPDALGLRDGGRHAARTGRSGELHRRAAQPRRRGQPLARRRPLRGRLARGSAHRLRGAEDRLRPRDPVCLSAAPGRTDHVRLDSDWRNGR